MQTLQERQEYDEWYERLMILNDRIDNLKIWDSYAERLQSRYDEMLTEDPRLKNVK